MKRVVVSLVLLGIAVLSSYLVGNYVLRYFTTRALSYAPALGQELGLAVEEPAVEVARISGPTSVYWRGISARTSVQAARTIARPGARYFVTIEYLGLRLLSTKRVLLEVEGMYLDPIPEDTASIFTLDDVSLADEQVPGRIRVRSLHFVFEVDSLFSPRKEIRRLLDEVRRLLSTGATEIGMTLQGEVIFALGTQVGTAKLITDTRDSLWVFLLDKQDLAKVSHIFDAPMTEGEIELVAKFPFRAAELIAIRIAVRDAVLEASRQAVDYPESALRQVLWSYLLSQYFGVEFAGQVTDSYQAQFAHDDPQAMMNYSNQRVGREWFAQGVQRQDIETLVLQSREVIRRISSLQGAQDTTSLEDSLP